jgi:hypothetical protein
MRKLKPSDLRFRFEFHLLLVSADKLLVEPHMLIAYPFLYG